MTGTPAPARRALKRVATQTHDEAVATLAIDDPRLDMFRPNPEIVNYYVSRKMPNGERDVDYLMKVWEQRENVLLVGDTQGGKTMMISVMAVHIGERMGLERDGKVLPVPVFTLSASNGITDFDMFGQPTAWSNPETSEEQIVWLPGLVDMAARVGGILYLDEVNMMPERVTSSLHPCTDWRRAFTNRAKAVQVPGDGFMPETVKLSSDLWVAGTMNPNYRGAGTLNEAFANRFRHLSWDYDASVETKLVPNDAVRTLGAAMRDARGTGHLRTPVGTAALMRFVNDVNRDGVDMAMFVLESMFTADERPTVREIVESRSFKALIQNDAEGRHPLAGSGDGAGFDPNSPF